MTWTKVPEALVTTYIEAMPSDPRIEPRKMFGCPCSFVNGHMFSGLHQENMILRLPEADRQALMAAGGTPFEPMAGRTMKEYVTVPSQILADQEALRGWLERSLEFAASLPPKEKKPAGAKKRKAGG